jgi:flagellar biosynthesis/type III secretory pathway protein FliH
LQKKARIIALAVAVIFLLGSVMPVVAAEGTQALKAIFRNIKIVVNGNVLVSDKEPFIVDGTTYVPLRLVGEAIGGDVQWDGVNNRVVITAKPSVDPAELQKRYQEGYDAGLKAGDLNGYVRGLQEGKAQVEDKRNAEKEYDKGYDDGLAAGEEDGYDAGEYDYDRGNKSDWKRAIDSDSTIQKDYKLSSKSDDYVDGFLKGYKEGFEDGYKDGYDSHRDYDDGYDDGRYEGYYAGYDQGESDKRRDRYNNAIPRRNDIIDDHRLDRKSKGYRDGFVEGYEDNYRRGYDDGYDGVSPKP